jgi:hypothetical protein
MKKLFPIGLTLIGVITIALMYFFPILILWIFLVMEAISFAFTWYIIKTAENAPKADQDFDTKFREESK